MPTNSQPIATSRLMPGDAHCRSRLIWDVAPAEILCALPVAMRPTAVHFKHIKHCHVSCSGLIPQFGMNALLSSLHHQCWSSSKAAVLAETRLQASIIVSKFSSPCFNKLDPASKEDEACLLQTTSGLSQPTFLDVQCRMWSWVVLVV